MKPDDRHNPHIRRQDHEPPTGSGRSRRLRVQCRQTLECRPLLHPTTVGRNW